MGDDDPDAEDVKRDRTFDPMAAFGSEAWCASKLGTSLSWFRSNRDRLEVGGFPPRDPLVRMRMKADVLAWIDRRRTIRPLESSQRDPDKGINWDAL